MSTARLTIPERDLQQLDAKLQGLSAVHQSQVLLNGMRAAGRAVRNRSKELAPAGSEPQEDRAALRTIQAYKVKAFLQRDAPVLELRVKAAKRAPHLHLVELGHEIVTGGTVPRKRGGKTPRAAKPENTGQGKRTGRFTKPALFLSRGGKYSQAQQLKAINDAAIRAIKRITGA